MVYFSNIRNSELQFFHGLTVPNFSISLSELLESSLFIVDSMGNSIYKIYPLFYTESILSNNEDDIILENKCIITSRGEVETYYSFISDSTAPVMVYNENMSFFNMEDKLSTSEFNSVVGLLRNKQPFTEAIEIRNSLVNGVYGDYRFDLNSTTIVDNGVLISRETQENLGTVRLENPRFTYSNYILCIRVISVGDYNIDLADRDNIIVTDLEIPLIVNNEVDIPFDNLELNNIISFDASVVVNHNKTFIQYNKHLSLSMSGYTGLVGDTIVLSAFYDDSGTPLVGYSIGFYDGDTLLDTVITDSTGYALLDYTLESVKEYKFNIRIGSQIVYIDPINPIRYETSLQLTTDKSLVYIPNNIFTLSGKLTIERVTGSTVKLYDNGTLVDTLSVDSSGRFSNLSRPNVEAVHNYQVIYEGDTIHYGCESNIVNVTCRKKNTNITINSSISNPYWGQSFIISGVLTDELDTRLAGKTVKLIDNNLQVATATTNNNGEYSFTRVYNDPSNHTFKVVFDENTTHKSVDNSKIVNVRKRNTNLSISSSTTNLEIGDSYTLSGVLKDETGTVLKSMPITIDGNSVTTDNTGGYSKTLTTNTEGTFSKQVNYGGNSYYNASSVTSPQITSYKCTIHVPDEPTKLVTDTTDTLWAYVTTNDNHIPNTYIKLYLNNQYVQTIHQQPNMFSNHFTFTTPATSGNVTLKIVYGEGTVKEVVKLITCTCKHQPVIYGDPIEIKTNGDIRYAWYGGVIKDSHGNPMSGVTCHMEPASEPSYSEINDATTGNTGVFGVGISNPSGLTQRVNVTVNETTDYYSASGTLTT